MHGVFDRFRRRAFELVPANVDPRWQEDAHWRQWPSPTNFVVGESYYKEALLRLCGPPREYGYLIPLALDIVRDPQNPYDGNALRVEVDGRQVGHIARQLAAQLAPPLDSYGCQSFRVCGILRGGSTSAPHLGVHVWLDRRLTPGPEIIQRDDDARVPWPPYDDEGTETPIDSGRSAHLAHASGPDPGYVRDRHFTEYVDRVKELRRSNHDGEAETLLLELIDATEAEAAAEGAGVAPWYYGQLAVLYSKHHDFDAEIVVLERFAAQPHSPGAASSRLLERLEKKRAKQEARRRA
jgi:hypothetical protein